MSTPPKIRLEAPVEDFTFSLRNARDMQIEALQKELEHAREQFAKREQDLLLKMNQIERNYFMAKQWQPVSVGSLTLDGAHLDHIALFRILRPRTKDEGSFQSVELRLDVNEDRLWIMVDGEPLFLAYLPYYARLSEKRIGGKREDE